MAAPQSGPQEASLMDTGLGLPTEDKAPVAAAASSSTVPTTGGTIKEVEKKDQQDGEEDGKQKAGDDAAKAPTRRPLAENKKEEEAEQAPAPKQLPPLSDVRPVAWATPIEMLKGSLANASRQDQ